MSDLGFPTNNDSIRLHLNENTFITLPEHKINMSKVSHYQTGSSIQIDMLKAEILNTLPEGIECRITPGSDEALKALICHYFKQNPANKFISALPCYSHVIELVNELIPEFNMCTFYIPYDTLTERIIPAFDVYEADLKQGALVYFCSPSNPTGLLYMPEQIIEFARRFPNAFIIVDHAYIEFVVSDFNMDKYLINLPNVFVVHTFSKIYGLAGYPVGYILGNNKRIIDELKINKKQLLDISVRLAFSSLYDKKNRDLSYFNNHSNKDFLFNALKVHGWFVINTNGNFILLYVGNSIKFENFMRIEHNIYVRPLDKYGLSGFVRITTSCANDSLRLFVNALLTSKYMPTGLPYIYYVKPIEKTTRLKLLLQQVLRLTHNTPLFAVCGTLLGIMRHQAGIDLHQGFIMPHDDDADIGYELDVGESDPMIELIEKFQMNGLKLQRNRTNAYWQVGTNTDEKISEIHVDIFPFTYNEEKKCYICGDPRFADENPESSDCNVKFFDGELYPLTRVENFLGQYSINIPNINTVDTVMRRSLGENYLTNIRVRLQDSSFIDFNS